MSYKKLEKYVDLYTVFIKFENANDHTTYI